MKFDSKYEPNQEVWIISSEAARTVTVCPTCNRSGKVRIGEEEFICPKCDGRSAYIRHCGQKWFVRESSEVGKIAITLQVSGYGENLGTPKVSYMLASTGVGSGQVWNEDDLWPTREEAQGVCDRRNGVLPVGDMTMDEYYQLSETR